LRRQSRRQFVKSCLCLAILGLSPSSVSFSAECKQDDPFISTQLLISQWANEKIRRVAETHRMYRARLKGKSGEYFLYEV